MLHQVYEETHPIYSVGYEQATKITLGSSKSRNYENVCNIIKTPVMDYYVSINNDYLVGIPTNKDGIFAPMVIEMDDLGTLHDFIEWLVEHDEARPEEVTVNLI